MNHKIVAGPTNIAMNFCCLSYINILEVAGTMSSTVQSVRLKPKFMTNKKKRQFQLIACLLPFMVAIALFSYVPITGWIYAFIDYTPGVSVFKSEFTGLKQFRMVFSGASDFWIVMRNTMCISGLNILCSGIPVVFAIMISQVKRKGFSRFVQTLSSIPNFISWVLVYSVVFMLISSEGSALNTILLGLNLVEKPTNVLINADMAWLVQVLIGVWKSTGYSAILYLAAITSIDQELYQAADVDGANAWKKILHITIPGIIPTFFVLLLLSISNMLSNGFEQFWLFGNGMTWDKLEVLDTYVYRMGIKNMEYSFSTALGIFKSVFSIILLTGANWASKKIRGQSIF